MIDRIGRIQKTKNKTILMSVQGAFIYLWIIRRLKHQLDYP